jgi:eukaryotic-like serine/threonine-protein kinase
VVGLELPNIQLGPELGHGAHSVVYRATLGTRPCAVKVPRSKTRWNRWAYRDAVCLARIRHPSLPEVLEVGEAEDLPYLVSELVVGETLESRLSGGRLAEPEALRIATGLVQALAALHDAGLVHRDVRPGNVVLDSSRHVRLIDLSFSAIGSRSGIRNDSTATRYLAPEQLDDSAPVEARADLYAVGQMLLECATGRPVSNGNLRAALSSAPCSQAYHDVVAALLGQDPDERYPDARALLSELERVTGGLSARGAAAYHATSKPLARLDGRQGDLVKLTEAMVELATTGRGSVVAVEGSRGGGKTSLLSAFARGVSEAALGRVLSVACRHGDPPLALLRRVMEAYLATAGRTARGDRSADEAALREAASGHLASFATLIAPQLASLLAHGGSNVEPPPGGFPEGAAELFLRLGRAAGPLLLCVDDLQWVDPISRQVLSRLAQRASSEPLLLVLSTRTGGSDPFLTELDQRRITRIQLQSLDEHQVGELIAAHLGDTEARPELARRVASLADGTPLGVFEVLGAMLDLGALRPKGGGWTVDVDRMSRMVLPDGSLALLSRRLREVPAATRRVLEMAAVLGAQFEDIVLARVVDIAPSDVAYALAEARRAGLLESGRRGWHRFVHDSAREMLTSAVDAAELRQLHVRIAESLDRETSDPETLYAIAAHYGAGDVEQTARKAYPAARKAAESALSRFDNETALQLFDQARRAASAGGIVLPAGFHRSVGEASLRLGALEQSRQAFEAALEAEPDQRARAAIQGRIAWVEHARGKPDLAWKALGVAFDLLAVSVPRDGVASAALAIRDILWSELRGRLQPGRRLEADARADAELLCSLHYQNSRLGLEYGKLQCFIGSAVLALKLSEPLGESRARAGSLATYGFVLTALGLRANAIRSIKLAEQMAARVGDPITIARCATSRASSAAFAGQIEPALALMHECLDVNAAWLEANEYCLLATSGELIESVRGRSTEAWAWSSRAVARQRGSYRMTALFEQVLVHRARACLASLGRTAEPGSWLSSELARTADAPPPIGNFYRGLFWGARVRTLVDSAELGHAFESAVREFESEGHDPRTVHPTATEYYVAVAHGRVHQFLRAPVDEREARLAQVERALGDLVAAAKLPLQRAHSLFLQGFVAMFRGNIRDGRRWFGDAEALATEENVPWVSYEIARARAHHLREHGKLDAAIDQARIAELLAREHGAEPRARWVREEFGLPDPATVPTLPDGEVNRAKHDRAALQRVLRAPELRPEQQGAAILAGLLRDLDADQGFILFQPDGRAGARMVVTKNRRGDESSETDAWRQSWLESVLDAGQPWPPPGVSDPVSTFGHRVDPLRVLAAPLFLGDTPVGATSLERMPGAPAFTAEDAELFALLSRQMAVALEVAQLFVERDQLHASLRQAQKMEAVGQVAGGMAHDFNNMINGMRSALDSIRSKVSSQKEIAEEIDELSKATATAGRLMRQLLGFSRHQAASPRPVSVNDLIRELQPMLKRLAGERVKIASKLDSELDSVSLVRSSFDQAMVNLVVNARDAMPEGGTVTIVTRATILDETAVKHGASRSGPHLAVDVSDTGQGIKEEHLHQVFDPFFTTKSAGNGTGLGLSTIYAFVRNSGGHVELTSVVGQGTTVSLFFPLGERAPVVGSVRPSGPPARSELS